MPSKAVVIAVTSFLLVVLICSLYSIPVVIAKPKVTKGPIECHPVPGLQGTTHDVECCQNTSGGGIGITYCTICDNTSPPSNCTPRYETMAPPTGNNTGTPPPVNIIKAPPGTIGSATNPSNSTGNSTAMKAAGVYSPTGFCARSVSTSCIPCDPGLPGGRDACIPSSDYPAPSTFKGKIGQGVATPLGNATNAQPIGNATSTLKLSPLTGQQPQTQQTTGHHHKGSNQGASTSSGSNSTSH